MSLRLNKIFFCVGVGFCFSLLFLFPLTADAEVITEENILLMINYQRQEHELQPLAINDTLSHLANLRAEDMVVNNYFSHQSPSGLMPWDIAVQENYDYKILGENLAMDYDETEMVLNDWMNSTNHRNNILNPQYSETGIEVIKNNDSLLIVQIFAQPSRQNSVISLSSINDNDQSVVSIIPNNSDTENLTVLGTYNIKNPANSQTNYINIYNLWIFLLALAFFPISLYFMLIPDKKINN
ncbi:MAG: CAP domain-containing protein [bacterium]|nr:CAP domain-containing protein [bacterium]